MSIFDIPEGWEPPSRATMNLLKRIIDESARDLRRELDTELRLTHHFWYKDIHFKMYLN